MPYADAFAPPRGIGQGLTGIVGPSYDISGSSPEVQLPSTPQGPFSPGGAFDPAVDTAREGLAKLFQSSTASGGGEGIDTISATLPSMPSSGRSLKM